MPNNPLKLNGGSAWESNPPTELFTRCTGFEVREGHQCPFRFQAFCIYTAPTSPQTANFVKYHAVQAFCTAFLLSCQGKQTYGLVEKTQMYPLQDKNPPWHGMPYIYKIYHKIWMDDIISLATVSSKGQITLPAKICLKHGIRYRDNIRFFVRENKIVIKPLQSFQQLRGYVSPKKGTKEKQWAMLWLGMLWEQVSEKSSGIIP